LLSAGGRGSGRPQAAAVGEGSSVPLPSFDHALQAHPNPFNPQTNLSFVLTRGERAAGTVAAEAVATRKAVLVK